MKELVCPECKSPISFFAFAQAPTPRHLKCGNCKAKLEPHDLTLVTVIICIYGLALGSTLGLVYLALRPPVLHLLAMLILGLIIFEGLAFYAYKLFKLELKSRE